jgi:tRNA A37 threonylcarbamoyladenosine biosynthesis protein TsaE
MSTANQDPQPYPVLIVVNFGAVRSASLELTPLLILTGPQGSGKSTLARLSYFFHELGTLFIRTVIQHYDPKNPELNADHFKEALASELYKIFGSHLWSSRETMIAFEWNNGLKLTITSSEDRKPLVHFNEALLQQLNQVGASGKESSTVTYLVEEERRIYGSAKMPGKALLDSAKHIFKFIAPPVYMEAEYHQLGYL